MKLAWLIGHRMRFKTALVFFRLSFVGLSLSSADIFDLSNAKKLTHIKPLAHLFAWLVGMRMDF